MTVEPMLIGVVFTLIYIPTQIVIVGLVVRDVWRNRWNGKFRMTRSEAEEKDMNPYKFAEGDLGAFVDTLFDHTVPQITWWIVFVYPMAAATVVSILWWIITVSAMYIQVMSL